MNKIDFECNMTAEELQGTGNHEEWGMAYMWLDNIGVEYNFSVDSGGNYSAIYKMVFNEESDYMETDYDTFIHYEIDFSNPDWKEHLKDAMKEALIRFFF